MALTARLVTARLVTASLASLLLLSGCAPDRTVDLTETKTPGASATPTATATGEPGATPVTIACTDLVSDQAIYDWGSGNWATDADFSVTPDTSAAQIVDSLGVACGWINLTSGEKLVVAVANLPADQLDAIKGGLVAGSTGVSNFGVEGYFANSGSQGQADAFTGTYWISAQSTAFFEAGDAEPIVTAAVSALG